MTSRADIHFLFFVCCFFYVVFSFGQKNPRLDSLEKVLSVASPDTQKVRTYFQLYAETAFNDPDQAKQYIEEALQLAQSLDDERGIILCYDKLGGVAMNNSDYKTATYYYQLADSLLQYQSWPREKAVIYGNFAAIYKDQGLYDSSLVWIEKFMGIAESIENEGFQAFGRTLQGDIFHVRGQNQLAIQNYLKAVRIYEKLGNQSRLADAFRLLGAAQTTASRHEDAEANLEKAIYLYQELNDLYYLGQAYRDFGYLYRLKEDYEKAEGFYDKALHISQQLEDRFGRAQAWSNLGELAMLREQYELALEYKRKALVLFQEIGDNFSEGVTIQEVANIFLRMSQYNAALANFQVAEEKLNEVGSSASMRFVYKGYYELFEAQGDPQKALEAYKAYVTISDSVYSVEKIRQLEELQLIYKVEKKDQEIALLSKDLQLGRLRRRSLFLGLIGLALIAGLIIYSQLVRRNKERKLASERHLRQQAELEKSKMAKSQVERELAGQVLQLCRKNELLASLQQEIASLSKEAAGNRKNFHRLSRSIEKDLQSDEDWNQFLATFEQVHPNFLNQLRLQADRLTPAEQRLACLFKMNLSSKEIATVLNISNEGVKKARYRLRKKLDVPSDVNLQDYLINFPDLRVFRVPGSEF